MYSFLAAPGTRPGRPGGDCGLSVPGHLSDTRHHRCGVDSAPASSGHGTVGSSRCTDNAVKTARFAETRAAETRKLMLEL